MGQLKDIINSDDPRIRDRSIDKFCMEAPAKTLLEEAHDLELFRREEENLYRRVRALFFLYAIHRFYLPRHEANGSKGIIPFRAVEHLLQRRYEEAIALFLDRQSAYGINEGISSCLANAYHQLGFQTLADQVKVSVRSTAGNQWMFRIGHPFDQPLKIKSQLLEKDEASGLYPCLHESTPVRMDLSHSGWSDIFFLGMDYPEAARVLNISVDLSVRSSSSAGDPAPPIETWLRVIDEPVLRLRSIDLGSSSTMTELSELFDFARDYLGLLKAALIASGIVPPGMEGAGMTLNPLLEKMVGKGKGLEVVSRVNNIPKGSRLAVSTNLLASLIALCMRATGQTGRMEGVLTEEERRLVASKAILGEWLGGSGGGWQDSGGVWPGMKLIQGVEATEGDPEFGVSKGCLLPQHTILGEQLVSAGGRKKLQDSLVMVHGGMAQDVGPVLEMVTEKYLLRTEKAWEARKTAVRYFDDILEKLKQEDVKGLGELTQRNFDGPIQDIIPWATNKYTQTIINRIKERFESKFWGFWMMGGMSGGGMGFIFDPAVKKEAQVGLQEIMNSVKKSLEAAIPFAMEPVVYDFRINENGTLADLLVGEEAKVPERKEAGNQLPAEDGREQSLDSLLKKLGFNEGQHEEIKRDLLSGRIGVSKNRLSGNTIFENPDESEITQATRIKEKKFQEIGEKALRKGEVAVLTLAGGAGSRWTKGAGVVKSLNPFASFEGRHRNFLEVHLAKTNQNTFLNGKKIQHVITTSFLTHPAIASFVEEGYGAEKNIYLSEGKVVGLRMIPTERDLRFLWEETAQQILDEQAQKVQESLQAALIDWAREKGEAEDYRDNLPMQCIHPVGHWFEITNMFLNGTLKKMVKDNPDLKHLMVHNIDTLGANLDPALLGFHIHEQAAMSVEVITRKLEDRGGGLAKVNGRLRLIEGLALPDERIEFDLSYYNSNTFWLDIDKLLKVFKLSRKDLENEQKIKSAVFTMATRMPTYITIKDVKKRWGKGQEDIFPVSQFEKLWGDMTTIPEMKCTYINVPRLRGQQLKEVSQLDGWVRDGSKEYVEGLCRFND